MDGIWVGTHLNIKLSYELVSEWAYDFDRKIDVIEMVCQNNPLYKFEKTD